MIPRLTIVPDLLTIKTRAGLVRITILAQDTGPDPVFSCGISGDTSYISYNLYFSGPCDQLVALQLRLH